MVATDMLKALNTTTLSNGRDVIYIIVETCRRSGNFNILYELLASLESCDELNSNENDIMPFLSESSNKGNMRQAYKLVEWFHDKHIPLTAKSYSTLLKGFGRQGNSKGVDKVLALCLEKNVHVDIILLNCAMDAYIRCGENEKAIAIFDSCRSDSNLLALGLTFLSKDYTSIVSSFSRLFLKTDLTPNINTYNTLLKGINSMNIQAFDVCSKVISLMKSNGVQPNSITTNTVIDICVNEGDMTGAMWYLENSTTLPGVEGYTSVIAGLSTVGDFRKSFQVLDSMVARNIYPNSHTFTSLTSASVSNGRFEEAKKLMESIQKTYSQYLTAAEVLAIKESYVIGLCNLAVRSDSDDKNAILTEARRLLLQIISSSTKVSTVLINSFMQGICSMDEPLVDQALLIVDAMVQDNYTLDDYTYSIIFNAAGKIGYVNEALNLYYSTERTFDAASLNALIHAFAKGPSAIDAILLYFQIQSDSSNVHVFKPDKLTFTSLLHAVARLLSNKNSDSSFEVDKLYAYVTQPYDSSEDPLVQQLPAKDMRTEDMPSADTDPLRPKSSTGRAIYDINFSSTVPNRNQKYNDNSSRLKFSSETSDPNELLSRIFLSMIQDYKVEVDGVIVAVLKSIFSSKKSSGGISAQTARFIFEELVISGYDPPELVSILEACKYPNRYEKQLLYDLDTVVKLRKSATSARIFRKYGWNSVESGWSPFF